MSDQLLLGGMPKELEHVPRVTRFDSLVGTTRLFECGGLDVRSGRLCHALGMIEDHHYTGRRTADPMHVFLWADKTSAHAAAVFTAPVNRYFGRGAVELARLIRMPDFALPLSRFVAAVLRWLKRNTDIRYCLAYADSTAGHHGGIYQALNFDHVGISKGNTQYRNDATGRIVSGRSFDQHSADNRAGWSKLRTGEKYLYVYPLNERRGDLLARFGWESLPYPKPERNTA